MGDLNGKTFFITGTSAGFGKALADEVLSRGGNVVAAARKTSAVADIVAKAPDRVLAVQLDVANNDEVAASVRDAMARFGRIDVLINNAGYGFICAIEEASDEQVRHQFDVNVFGPAALMRAVLPHMRAAHQGCIVNISSTAGTRGFPGSGYYCASKAALEAMTESLAGEAANLGIKALIVEPGPFRTEFSGRSLVMPANQLPEYEAAAATRKMTTQMDGKQAGDPVRGSKIIVDTAISANPPMRLVLGGLSFTTALQAFQTKIDDIERSRHIAPTADFPAGE